MHELALAQDIIETIERNAGEDISKLIAISLEVGEFSSVVMDSLEFGLKFLLEQKNLRDVVINMTKVQAMALCECKTGYRITTMLDACPSCGSYNRRLISGTDVIIKSIEVSD